MSKIVFGRDRIPEAWPAPPPVPECRPGTHLVDLQLARCTVCLWLDPSVERCATQGCEMPGEYVAEMGPASEGPAFTTILETALFCQPHALLGGLSLLPGAQA